MRFHLLHICLPVFLLIAGPGAQSVMAAGLERTVRDSSLEATKTFNTRTRTVSAKILQDATEETAMLAALVDKIITCGASRKFYNQESDQCQ